MYLRVAGAGVPDDEHTASGLRRKAKILAFRLNLISFGDLIRLTLSDPGVRFQVLMTSRYFKAIEDLLMHPGINDDIYTVLGSIWTTS